jgi:FixJ family two-component response regulator
VIFQFSLSYGSPNDLEDERPVVYIADDDSAACAALWRLIRSVGLRAQASASGVEFLRAPRPDVPECLLMSGCSA